MELRGEIRRGYFVHGLGGVQFASNEFVEELRAFDDSRTDGPGLAVVRSSDPAWALEREMVTGDDSPGSDLLRDNRLAGATIVMSDRPLLVGFSNGARVHAADDADISELSAAVAMLLDECMRSGGSSRVRVREWNGSPVLRSDGVEILESAGFRRDYPYMIADALTRRVPHAVYH